jgi:CHAT domain-containing protein
MRNVADHSAAMTISQRLTISQRPPIMLAMLCLALPSTSIALAQGHNAQVGSTAYVVRWRADLKDKDQVLATIPSGKWARIDVISGKYLYVNIEDINGKRVRGWVHQDDVLLRRGLTQTEQNHLRSSNAIYDQIQRDVFDGIFSAKDFLDRARQALDLASSVWGVNHPEVARFKRHVAGIYLREGEYRLAESLFSEILDLRRKALPSPHADLAEAITDFAPFIDDDGKQAELYRESVEICSAILGKQHHDYLVALQSCGAAYFRSGQLTKARDCFEQLVSTLQNADKHPWGLDAALELAYICAEQKDEAAVTATYDKAFAWVRGLHQRLGQGPGEVSIVVHQAEYYESLGRQPDAEKVFVQAIERVKQNKKRPWEALLVSNKSIAFQLKHGRLEKAAEACRAALEYFASLDIPNDMQQQTAAVQDQLAITGARQHATSIQYQLAIICARQAKYAAAIEVFQDLIEHGYDPLDTDKAGWLQQLGVLHLQVGNLDAADRALQQCATYAETNFITGLLSNARGQSRRSLEALDGYRKEIKGFQAEIRLNNHYVPEYVGDLQRKDAATLGHCLAIALSESQHDAEWSSRAAEWIINQRASGAEDVAAKAANLRTAKYSKQLADLRLVRNGIASLAVAGASPDHRGLQMLRERELSLLAQVPMPRTDKARFARWTSLDEIRGRLPPDAAYLVFSQVRLPGKADLEFALSEFLPHLQGEDDQYSNSWNAAIPAHYVACLVPAAGRGSIELFDLGDAKQIDAAIELVQRKLAQALADILTFGEVTAEEELNRPLKELSALLLTPLESSLATSGKLIVSPDCALWLAPFCALITSEGKHLVETHAISYLISGRELVDNTAPASARSPAVIFADPDYDLAPQRIASNQQPDNLNFAVRSAGVRLSQPLDRLPSTTAEAQGIRSSLIRGGGGEPVMLIGEKATADAVKQVQRPRLLVLSTHAYFDPDLGVAEKTVSEQRLGYDVHKTRHRQLIDPLLQCGLMFAGCNHRSKQATVLSDDGVLTGLEILGMDLEATELVVLSACETGLGRVNAGEGIASLRQSFQLAGAQSVLASSWQIDDRETMALVTQFFDRRAAGNSNAAALQAAQLARIKARRKSKGAAHPYFWAAFSLTGAK